MGAALHSMSDDPPPVEPPKVTFTSCFSRDDLGNMAAARTYGVRFYISQDASRRLVALGCGINDTGGHVVDATGKLQFRQFRSVLGRGTEMNLLEESDAKSAVLAAKSDTREPWSVDVDSTAIKSLLGVTDANGIGLMERRTTGHDWTFVFTPVKLEADVAHPVGTDSDILVGSMPCPMTCPKDPSLYLHRH